MKEYYFDMSQLSYGEAMGQLVLVEDQEKMYLRLYNTSNEEVSCIQVLPISKREKLINFFKRGFNLSIKEIDEIIPLEHLMEKERKIVVDSEDALSKIEIAKKRLESEYELRPFRSSYERTMLYLETDHYDFQKNNRIFRLTQEGNEVKATIHMNNHLPGDQKHIIKFFFTNTNMNEVVSFFEASLGLHAVTREITSTREEYKSSFGEISIDHMHDGVDYYVIEMEMDSFQKNSKETDEIAQKIAENIGLQGSLVVDQGTEEIHKLVTDENYFDTYSVSIVKKI